MTGIFWRLVLMENHTDLLLATPSMCQSRDLLIHVLCLDYPKKLSLVNFNANTNEVKKNRKVHESLSRRWAGVHMRSDPPKLFASLNNAGEHGWAHDLFSRRVAAPFRGSGTGMNFYYFLSFNFKIIKIFKFLRTIKFFGSGNFWNIKITWKFRIFYEFEIFKKFEDF